MTEGDKRRLLKDIINAYARGEGTLDSLLEGHGISRQRFYSLIKTLSLSDLWEWAKLERKRSIASEDSDDKEEVSGPPMVISSRGQLVPVIHPDASDKDRAVLALELYTETDLPLVECVEQVGLGQTKFFKMVLQDKDLSALEKDAQELRSLITRKRLEVDKKDAMDITTRKVFDRVLKGSKEVSEVEDLQEEKILDAAGNVMGTKQIVKKRNGESHSDASVSELRLALQLLKLGDKDVQVPEAAMTADDVEFNPDDIPDLSMMDIDED